MDNNNPRAPHRQAWDLIPWVVGGSASPTEQLLVSEHVATCPDCREELAFHTALRAGLAATTAAPHAVEPAWQRMQARIGPDAADQIAAVATVAASPAASSAGPAGNRLIRMLVAAVVVQAVGLGVLGAALLQGQQGRSDHQGRNGTDYQTLSQVPTARSAATIRLVPAAELGQAQLQALLKRTGTLAVEINADGSLLGLSIDPTSGRSLDQALLQLRSEPGVMLAEPMPEAPTAAAVPAIPSLTATRP